MERWPREMLKIDGGSAHPDPTWLADRYFYRIYKSKQLSDNDANCAW